MKEFDLSPEVVKVKIGSAVYDVRYPTLDEFDKIAEMKGKDVNKETLVMLGFPEEYVGKLHAFQLSALCEELLRFEPKKS